MAVVVLFEGIPMEPWSILGLGSLPYYISLVQASKKIEETTKT
jgi:hypothetical protein